MPRGRPKKLSNYEQVKARKIRKILSDYNIARFDKINDANLLNTVQVDSSGKVFVSATIITMRIYRKSAD